MDKVFVGNLAFDTTEEDIHAHFASVGEVGIIKVVRDRETGRSRGFAFVEVENAAQAIEAFNGKELGERTLKVDHAKEREERPGRGGARLFRRPRTRE